MLLWALVMQTVLPKRIGKLYTHDSITGLVSLSTNAFRESHIPEELLKISKFSNIKSSNLRDWGTQGGHLSGEEHDTDMCSREGQPSLGALHMTPASPRL